MTTAEQTSCSVLLGGPDGDERLHGLHVTVWDLPTRTCQRRPAGRPGAVAALIADVDRAPGTQTVYIGVGLSDQVGEGFMAGGDPA